MSAPTTAPLGVSRQGAVVTLTVDRPPVNVLDLETLAALGEAVEVIGSDESVQLVVVRGAGPKAFSAGVSVQDHTLDKVPEMISRFHRVLNGLRNLPCPTLAAVHGHCLGGGMELALACDFVLAADSARFGQPEIELGCFPPYAAALYPRWIGERRALEMILTGRVFSALEAKELGLVHWLTPAEELERSLAEVVARLTSKSAAAMRLAKRAVRAGAESPFPEALAECERLYLEDLCQTEDMLEGLGAYLEKRKPEWRHR